MSSTIRHIEDFVTKAGDLAETKMELWKLRVAQRISETISSLISMIVTAALIVVAITIASFGLAYWIGSAMGHLAYGFFIVGGFYAIAGLLLYLFRKQWIKKPVRNLVIDKIIK